MLDVNAFFSPVVTYIKLLWDRHQHPPGSIKYVPDSIPGSDVLLSRISGPPLNKNGYGGLFIHC